MKLSFSPLMISLFLSNLFLVMGSIALAFFYESDAVPHLSQDGFSMETSEQLSVVSRTVSKADYALLSRKPLFHETRKPVEIAKPEPVQPTKQIARSRLTDYLLTGIVYRSSGEGLVYLTNRKNGQKYKLQSGDMFDGWKVEEIKKTEVIVSRGGRQEPLKLVLKSK